MVLPRRHGLGLGTVGDRSRWAASFAWLRVDLVEGPGQPFGLVSSGSWISDDAPVSSIDDNVLDGVSGTISGAGFGLGLILAACLVSEPESVKRRQLAPFREPVNSD